MRRSIFRVTFLALVITAMAGWIWLLSVGIWWMIVKLQVPRIRCCGSIVRTLSVVSRAALNNPLTSIFQRNNLARSALVEGI
jgi:hypothetical protein